LEQTPFVLSEFWGFSLQKPAQNASHYTLQSAAAVTIEHDQYAHLKAKSLFRGL
jgi:hypothetical protein